MAETAAPRKRRTPLTILRNASKYFVVHRQQFHRFRFVLSSIERRRTIPLLENLSLLKSDRYARKDINIRFLRDISFRFFCIQPPTKESKSPNGSPWKLLWNPFDYAFWEFIILARKFSPAAGNQSACSFRIERWWPKFVGGRIGR